MTKKPISDSLKPLIRQLLPPNTTMPTIVQTGTSSLPAPESSEKGKSTEKEKGAEKDKNSEKDKSLPKAGANAEKDDWAKYSKEEVQPTNPEVDMTPGDSSPAETVATDTERKEDVKETAGEVKQEENLKKENPEDERELEHSPTEATISFEAKDDGKAPENADTGSVSVFIYYDGYATFRSGQYVAVHKISSMKYHQKFRASKFFKFSRSF